MWSLFVDTDFVYLESRRLYGSSARMDYLHLPLYIVESAGDIDFFQSKLALVMRHGRDWGMFAKSLERFGYDVVPTDRGMQPHTVSSIVTHMVMEGQKVILVTAAERLNEDFLVRLLENGGVIRLATFGNEAKDGVVVTLTNGEQVSVDTLFMNRSWLWEPGTSRGKGDKHVSRPPTGNR